MKKGLPLPLKLLLGIVIGGALGVLFYKTLAPVLDATNAAQLAEGVELTTAQFICWSALQVIVCVHRLMGQFIMFCVPLIVLGFICPSITKMGQNAGKLLGVALIIAYTSSILAATMSAAAGYVLVPQLGIDAKEAFERTLPAAIFQLDIPQIMPVIAALVLSIVVGLAAVWTKSKTTIELLGEFQNIVLDIVNKIVIPILPFYIGTTFANLGYNGTLEQFPVFIKAIIIVMIGHYIWLAVLYLVAGAYSGKNPFEVIKHYGPAYITAVGTMSSAATLSVALECAKKSEPPLRDDLVSFGIPLFANIHLCGSVMTETFFVMAVSKMLYGEFPSPAKMILFCLLLGVFAIGAPGVPGGTVMASLGLITGVLGFDENGTALMLTIFALQDSFGTACNVTGDGALTLFLTGYAEKHGIAEVTPEDELA